MVLWRDMAACSGMGTDLFFPAENPGGPRQGKGIRGERERAAVAKDVCSGCPVRGECLEFGRAERYGIFGGLTPRERFHPM